MYYNDKKFKWINLLYTTLVGHLKEVTVIGDEKFSEKAKIGFGKLDGSSIPGFKKINESDLLLMPDLSTLREDPFRQESAIVISDIYEAGGKERFSKDPRYVAKKLEDHIASLGLKALVGAEVEFYIVDNVEVWLEPYQSGYKIVSDEAADHRGKIGLDFKSGYHAPMYSSPTYEIRDEISRIMVDKLGIKVESHHHEVAALGQAEINIMASTPKETSDNIQLLKMVSKGVCHRKNKRALFMPKLVVNDNGSGMHIHISLWKDGRNLFYDENDGYAELSQMARYFIGGLIEHGRSLSAFVSPTVNSYKRLVPYYEAPVFLVWGKSNRSSAIRIPHYYQSVEYYKRIEYRPPDPSANPYLAISATIMAGLDGIKKKIDPGDPMDIDIYKIDREKSNQLGIKSLPSSLLEAIDELDSDFHYLLPVFSRELIDSYIEVKREEWMSVQKYVSPAEIFYYGV